MVTTISTSHLSFTSLIMILPYNTITFSNLSAVLIAISSVSRVPDGFTSLSTDSNVSPPIVSLSGLRQISIMLYMARWPHSGSFLALLKYLRAEFGFPRYLSRSHTLIQIYFAIGNGSFSSRIWMMGKKIQQINNTWKLVEYKFDNCCAVSLFLSLTSHIIPDKSCSRDQCCAWGWPVQHGPGRAQPHPGCQFAS